MPRAAGRILVGMLSCLAIGCAWPWDEDLPNLVTISSPSDGAAISGTSVRVAGASRLQDDIWVFVYPEMAPGRGYPQSVDGLGNPSTLRDGTGWSVVCNLGGGPQFYDLVVYTATPAASLGLRQVLKEWFDVGFSPGLTTVPQGLREWSRVRIRRDR